MVELIKTVIADFHQRTFLDDVTFRKLSVPLHSGKIVTIMGPRRAGKTWYLYSLIEELKKNRKLHTIVYINFEDERFEKSKDIFQNVIDAYGQLYPDVELREVYFFFDEIQEIPGWEKFVRRLHDTISTRIFLTGSSAKLMSSEIATALRGRTLSYLLLPFSFSEYLDNRAVSYKDISSTKNKNRIVSLFETFIFRGGYPETFDYDETVFVKTMQSYVDIMLYRDIVERHSVHNVHLVKDLMKRLIASNGQYFSVNKYYNDCKSQGFHVSKDSLYELLGHFEDARAVLLLSKYSDSIVRQARMMKKIYVNDTGIAAAFNFTTKEDTGWLLETFVFLELLKHDKAVYTLTNGFETDFIIQDRTGSITSAIQVCKEVNDKNRTREFRGLQNAMEMFGLKDGHVITYNQEEILELEYGRVHLVPGWKWALSLSNVY